MLPIHRLQFSIMFISRSNHTQRQNTSNQLSCVRVLEKEFRLFPIFYSSSRRVGIRLPGSARYLEVDYLFHR